MPIDPQVTTGEWREWVEREWTSKDALLYALGVGHAPSRRERLGMTASGMSARGVNAARTRCQWATAPCARRAAISASP